MVWVSLETVTRCEGLETDRVGRDTVTVLVIVIPAWNVRVTNGEMVSVRLPEIVGDLLGVIVEANVGVIEKVSETLKVPPVTVLPPVIVPVSVGVFVLVKLEENSYDTEIEAVRVFVSVCG